MTSPSPYTIAILQDGYPVSELSPAGTALVATALYHLAESCRRIPGRTSLAWRAEALLDILSKVRGIESPLETKRRAARFAARFIGRRGQPKPQHTTQGATKWERLSSTTRPTSMASTNG